MSKDKSSPETSHETTKKSLNKQKLFSYFLLLISGALFFIERLQEPPFPLDFGPLSAAGLTVLTGAIFSLLYLSEIGEYRMDLTHHSEEIKELTKKISELQSMAGLGDSVLELNARSSGRVFTPLLTSKLVAVRADIADMASGAYEFNYRRKRDAYAKEFREIIKAMLDSGTTFRTVTNTVFWSDAGINVADQYMGAMLNSLAYHEGLEIERLIITSKAKRSSEIDTIRRHAQDLNTYKAPLDRCRTKVLELDEPAYNEHFKRGGNFAVWKYQNIRVALIVDYALEANGWEVDKIRFVTNEGDLTGKRAEFDRLFERCQDTVNLFDYVAHLDKPD